MAANQATLGAIPEPFIGVPEWIEPSFTIT
jgi:hypothetical protein